MCPYSFCPFDFIFTCKVLRKPVILTTATTTKRYKSVFLNTTRTSLRRNCNLAHDIVCEREFDGCCDRRNNRSATRVVHDSWRYTVSCHDYHHPQPSQARLILLIHLKHASLQLLGPWEPGAGTCQTWLGPVLSIQFAAAAAGRLDAIWTSGPAL